MIGFPPPAGRISKVPLSESPRTLPVEVVTTSALAERLWYGPSSLTTTVSLTSRARTGTGGAVSEVYVIVPRNEPSCATAVTMRNGIPVSDALRYDRPSHVPAYFRAGPPGAPDFSLGAHALRTTAAHSSLRMLDLRYVLGMEYERRDGFTQGTREVRGAGLLPEHLERHLDLPERGAHLHALHRALHLLKHFPSDLHAFGERGLFALVLRLAHPRQHRLRHRDAGHFVGEELGVPQREERPDPCHDRDLELLDACEKCLELRGIEHRLGHGELRPRIHLPREA